MRKKLVLKVGDIKKSCLGQFKGQFDQSNEDKSNYFHVLYLTYLDSHTHIEVSRQFLFSTNNKDII